MRSEAVVAGQHDDEGFRGDDFEHQIGCPCFWSEECHIELVPDKSIREVGIILAGDGDLDIRELVPKEADRFGEPVYLLSGREAQSERRLGGLRGAPCRFAGSLDLSQSSSAWSRKTRPAAVSSMPRRSGSSVERRPRPPGPGSDDEGRLRRVEPPLGGDGQTSLLGDSDEIAQMAQLHIVSHACEVSSPAHKVFVDDAIISSIPLYDSDCSMVFQ